MHDTISTPADATSVRAVLRSPRRLTTETLAGLVTALALIPEVISFAVIAGVDPRVALYTSCIMAMTIAFVGGRPAMVSAAAGATALVVAPLVASHGIDYLIAAVWLAGVLQILFAVAGLARLVRFIPRSVMIGFVNALAILIFSAQLRHLFDVPWLVYPLVAAGLAMIVLLPRLTKAVPAPLIAIVVLTGAVALFRLDVPDVADQGELPSGLPTWMIPDVPLTWDTLTIIAPFALGLALVGLLESLLTAKLVDDITDTPSDKTREAWGQGVANAAGALFGGMGGCAMIGQTMINVKEGRARTRISTFLAGAFLLVLCVTAGGVVGAIPMAALVAVMLVIAVTTFDWRSVAPRTLRLMPRSETLVMLVTVVGTLATHNLAVGVVLGVLTAMVAFARRVAHLTRVDVVDRDGERTYRVSGELFWASSNDLVHRFDYAGDPDSVVIDLAGADVWDASTVATLDTVQAKYTARGKSVRIVGLDGASLRRLEQLSGRLG
ncbi:SulP family inorganic anion transporter [Prescottella equi]|uniref:STAS domain-containing protein n=1 Tax=Rhodococcus hoagii TaxID=43767 RepID=A0AAE5IQS8_RHOHA|nr:SulP family inorganic anion transporter [Prescottella equi]ERN46151.1 sulfate transporter [Prescottella equi NBRC 101255 = C 7]MBM4626199.1 STAS domain-containing protein [Prescottella equi]ORL25952.1 sodium-independent anion transporter [Prescottella equi]ORL99533.1 sodium-independent anion transporter [Prescottella equi]ORM24379.1 sodium-independent anion transporter [Prescottella equi]